MVRAPLRWLSGGEHRKKQSHNRRSIRRKFQTRTVKSVPEITLPGRSDRLVVIGRNGSGKTQAAAHWLSGKDFTREAWVMVNTKGDELLNEIAGFDGVKTITLQDTPGKTGLYMVRPLPNDDALEAFLWRIWAREKCGIYVDEGYMIGRFNRAFNALLTQGRSKKIPMIILAQRPSWLSQFVFSEATYYQVFHLNSEDDRKTVAGFVPLDRKTRNERLPDFHSLWYEVKSDTMVRFSPVPPRENIIEAFAAKLTRRKRFL